MRAAADIAAALRAYIADINAKRASCRSDKEVSDLRCEAFADMAAAAVQLVETSAYIDDITQIKTNGTHR